MPKREKRPRPSARRGKAKAAALGALAAFFDHATDFPDRDNRPTRGRPTPNPGKPSGWRKGKRFRRGKGGQHTPNGYARKRAPSNPFSPGHTVLGTYRRICRRSGLDVHQDVPISPADDWF